MNLSNLSLDFFAGTVGLANEATRVTGYTLASLMALDTINYINQTPTSSHFCVRTDSPIPIIASIAEMLQGYDPCYRFSYQTLGPEMFYGQAIWTPLVVIITHLVSRALQKIEDHAHSRSAKLDENKETPFPKKEDCIQPFRV